MTKIPHDGQYTSFLIYCTCTKIRKIWSDISVKVKLVGHFCIPRMYQTNAKSCTKLKFKNHVPNHIPNQNLKWQFLRDQCIIFIYCYRSYIKIMHFKILNLNLDCFKFDVFPVQSSWVRAINFGALNRVVITMSQLFEFIRFFKHVLVLLVTL